MKKVTILFALLWSMSVASATIYYVKLGTNGTASWDASYASTGTIVDLSTVNKGSAATFNAWFADKSLATPQFAGTKLASGDQVWIAAGTYYLTGTVTLKAGVSIYGGFAGTAGETVANRAKNSTDKWDFSNITALDGSVGGVKTYIAITGGDAVLTTLVDGLTIQNCNNGSTSTSGGAGKITGAATTMQNCIITACTLATGSTAGTGASAGITLTAAGLLKDSYIHHNTASTNYGGGITVSGSLCTVSGCKIEYNTTTGDGGGIYLYSYASGVNISNCSFSYNSANLAGGAIATYVTNAPASPIGISTCTFTGNNAKGSGGAMNLSVTGATFNISGCTFTSNYSTVSSSTGAGGGALILSNSAFSIDKCTFTGNYTTLSSGGAITIPSTSSCTISNSKFLANTAGSTTTSSGSAIYSKSNYTANNCLFADNTGITPITFYTSAAASTYQNCTFANNLSSTGTAAPIVLLNIGSSPYPPYIFSNCLFYNVSQFSGQTNPTTTNCASDRALSNISIKTIAATDFVDADNATIANRNYSLAAGSNIVDAGTTIAACSPDIAGVIRPQGDSFDIGVYEYVKTTPTVTISGADSFTYNGSPNGPNTATNTGTSSSYNYSYSGTGNTSYAASSTQPTLSGTYTVTATVATNKWYNAATSAPYEFSIAKATVTVTAVSATKTYNRTTASAGSPTVGTLASGDVINTAPTQTYDNANYGTTHVLTPAGLTIRNARSVDVTANYTITYTNSPATGVIDKAALTVTGVTATKTYNGTTSSAGSPTVGTLVSGDIVNVAAIQTYDNKNYGTTHVLTPSGLTIKDGSNTDMTSNYSITYTPSPATGVIDKTALTVTGVTATKTYNGTTSSAGSPTVGTLVSGDVVNVAAIQTYDNKNYGTTHVL
ncbi:MAG: YDG domain-containing protein, partial [Paludibacter sp.]